MSNEVSHMRCTDLGWYLLISLYSSPCCHRTYWLRLVAVPLISLFFIYFLAKKKISVIALFANPNWKLTNFPIFTACVKIFGLDSFYTIRNSHFSGSVCKHRCIHVFWGTHMVSCMFQMGCHYHFHIIGFKITNNFLGL